MKFSLHKVFLFSIFFLFYNSAFSQQNDFAPVGAQWYYNYWIGQSPPDAEYLKYESIKDTLITGKNCRVIEIIHYKYSGDSSLFGYEYMYGDSGKVYYWCTNQFYLIYDFTGFVGDTFTIGYREIYNCTSQVVDVIIDSIDTVVITGIPLRRFFIHYNPEPNGGGWYYFPQIEKIGSELLMFGGYTQMLESPGPLRCYQDSNIYYKKINYACDYRIISDVDEINFQKKDNSIIIPNPLVQNSIIEFSNPNKIYAQLIFHNILGEKVLSFITSSNQIVYNGNLKQGTYFYTFFLNDIFISSNLITIF